MGFSAPEPTVNSQDSDLQALRALVRDLTARVERLERGGKAVGPTEEGALPAETLASLAPPPPGPPLTSPAISPSVQPVANTLSATPALPVPPPQVAASPLPIPPPAGGSFAAHRSARLRAARCAGRGRS